MNNNVTIVRAIYEDRETKDRSLSTEIYWWKDTINIFNIFTKRDETHAICVRLMPDPSAYRIHSNIVQIKIDDVFVIPEGIPEIPKKLISDHNGEGYGEN